MRRLGTSALIVSLLVACQSPTTPSVEDFGHVPLRLSLDTLNVEVQNLWVRIDAASQRAADVTLQWELTARTENPFWHPQVGVAAAYVLLRGIGKVGGPLLAGSALGSAQSRLRLGMALLPQAGVALGLALAAKVRFPDEGTAVFNVVVAGTVVFELLGPVLTRAALTGHEPGRGPHG